MSRLTKAMREIADDLDGQEALRQGSSFWAGGFNIGDEPTITKMARRGFVEIDTVGESVFARLTPAGRAALAAHQENEGHG